MGMAWWVRFAPARGWVRVVEFGTFRDFLGHGFGAERWVRFAPALAKCGDAREPGSQGGGGRKVRMTNQD